MFISSALDACTYELGTSKYLGGIGRILVLEIRAFALVASNTESMVNSRVYAKDLHIYTRNKSIFVHLNFSITRPHFPINPVLMPLGHSRFGFKYPPRVILVKERYLLMVVSLLQQLLFETPNRFSVKFRYQRCSNSDWDNFKTLALTAFTASSVDHEK